MTDSTKSNDRRRRASLDALFVAGQNTPLGLTLEEQLFRFWGVRKP